MVHRTAYVENYSEYAVPKLPITKDDFSVDNFIDQDSAKIGVSGGVLNYNFVKDGTTDTSTRDLKVVSNNRWILRFNLVVNTLTNPSVGTSFGIIGISNKTTTGNENFIGMMIVRNSAGVGSYRALSTSNGLPISGIDSSIFTTIPTTSDNYFIEIKRESRNSARMTIFSDSAYTVIVESRVFTTAGLGAPIDQNIKDLRYIKLQNVIDSGIGGGSIAGTIDNLLFINEQLGVSFQDDFSGADNWTDTTSQIGVNTSTDVIDFDFSINDTTNHCTAYDLGAGNVSNSRWVLRGKTIFSTVTLGSNNYLYIGIGDENQASGRDNAQDFIGIAFRGSAGVNAEQMFVVEADGTTIPFSGDAGFDNSVFYSWAVGIPYYWEVQRISPTEVKTTVYSDSAYTIPLVQGKSVVPNTITGLRYIKIFNSMLVPSEFIGTIDDIEFFNGQGITFQDDLTTSTNWASTGTKVTISGGKINWDAKATDTLAQGTSHDFGVGFVSGNSWTLRFKFTVDTFVFQTSNSMDLVIGLFAEDHTKKADVTTTGWHGIYGNWAVTNPLENVAIITNDGSAITGGTLPSLLAFNGMYNSHATIQTAYCELKRTSATLAEFNIYQDPAYSVLLSKGIVAIQAGLTEDLRYLMVKTFDNAVVVGGSWSGTVDDVEFYNGIAPRPLLPRLIDTFQDDFTYITQGDADTRWVSSDVALNRVNITTDVLDWDMNNDATNNSIVYDLGSVSDNNWILRFKWTVTTATNPSASTTQGMIGIFSDDQSVAGATGQRVMGLLCNMTPSAKTYHVNESNGTIPVQGTGDATFTHALAVETLYIEIKKLIKTHLPDYASLFIVSLYSDPEYTNLIESQAGIGFSNGLRYIGIKNASTSNNNGVLQGTIDNIQFWNDVIVINTVKTPVLDIEFDFSTSNGWVQTSTGVSVNTTLGQIDGFSNDGSDKRVTFDMGANGLLNDQDWTVELEYEFSASSIPAHGILSITDTNFDPWASPAVTGDAIGINHGISINQLQITAKDGAIGMIAGASAIPIFDNVRYYVRLERVKNSTLKLSIFSDPDFTQHITGSPIFFTSAELPLITSVSNLRYIHSGNESQGGGARTLTGFIKNLKLYRTIRGTDKDNKYLVIG